MISSDEDKSHKENWVVASSGSWSISLDFSFNLSEITSSSAGAVSSGSSNIDNSKERMKLIEELLKIKSVVKLLVARGQGIADLAEEKENNGELNKLLVYDELPYLNCMMYTN